MDLVTLGEILIDMFPSELGKPLRDVPAFIPKPGGAPANVAVAAARLGAQTAFLGKAGDEAFGQSLVELLRREGVETSGMLLDPDVRTTLAFIAMPDPFSAEFVFYRNPGADLCIRPDELDQSLLRKTKAFHCGSLSLVAEPARSATFAAISAAAESGALISFDVNYRPSLWKDPAEALEQIQSVIPLAQVLKVNETEARLLTGLEDYPLAARQLLSLGPALIVITLGAQGSYYGTAHAEGYVPAFKVETVDSIGCGDAFVAGLLTRLTAQGDWRAQLNDNDLRAAFRYASAVGAITALTQGVIPALPYANQVADFLAQHPENSNN